MLRRIEVYEPVVVPEQAVAHAGDVHGYRNLRVDLRQASREPAHVEVAVLELSQAEESLAFGRIGRERRPVERMPVEGSGFQAVSSGPEHALSFCIPDSHGACRRVGLDAHKGCRHQRRAVFRSAYPRVHITILPGIDPFRHQAFRGFFPVGKLYPDASLVQRGELQRAAVKTKLHLGMRRREGHDAHPGACCESSQPHPYQ